MLSSYYDQHQHYYDQYMIVILNNLSIVRRSNDPFVALYLPPSIFIFRFLFSQRPFNRSVLTVILFVIIQFQKITFNCDADARNGHFIV